MDGCCPSLSSVCRGLYQSRKFLDSARCSGGGESTKDSRPHFQWLLFWTQHAGPAGRQGTKQPTNTTILRRVSRLPAVKSLASRYLQQHDSLESTVIHRVLRTTCLWRFDLYSFTQPPALVRETDRPTFVAGHQCPEPRHQLPVPTVGQGGTATVPAPQDDLAV